MLKIVILYVFGAFLGVANADVASGKATTITLSDGNVMPVLGLGTWLNGGSDEGVQKAVEVAIDSGYRHIDTAAIYDTEKQVGQGLKNKFDNGTVKREDMFITTKLWNDNHKQSKVVPALRKSLENLGLKYVDLYLIHWPISVDEKGGFDNIDYIETWKGMEEAKKLGLTKSIGVSNFNVSQIDRVYTAATDKPVVNQIEVNPNMAQKSLIAMCNEKKIQVVAYTPLGSMPEPRAKNKDSPAPKIDDPILTEIGKKYNKNTVQVVLRYLIDRGLATIPKSVTPSRIEQNIEVFDFKLTPEEMLKIDSFNLDRRVVNPEYWRASPFYPFNP